MKHRRSAPEIRIVISTDLKGFAYNATLIGSILRRTESPVHVRCWCRGFLPESFGAGGRLRVEFVAAEGGEGGAGRYPGHVGEAVFDRLRAMRDCADWERCLVMDHDMVALCDLAPYFAEDFGGNLLLGRLFGPGNTLGLQMRARGGLPEAWRHAEDYPYFYMGPMLNLAAMREEGIWEKFLEAHAEIGQDEQISLTAACGGRVKAADKRWNLAPQWDALEEGPDFGEAGAPEPGAEARDARGVPWRNGVPAGVVHWTGPQKPWQRWAKVWRPDVWEAERTNWEELRLGLWEKPLAAEVEPPDGFGVRALARRGWRVRVFCDGFRGLPPGARRIDGRDADFQDVEKLAPPGGGEEGAARSPEGAGAGLGAAEIVRFGPGAAPAGWLGKFAGDGGLPRCVAVRGPAEAGEIEALRRLGYALEARLRAGEWPTGGPAPEVLEFSEGLPPLAVGEGEEAYLRRSEEAEGGGSCGTGPARESEGKLSRAAEAGGIGGAVETGAVSELPEAAPGFGAWLAGLPGDFRPRSILELGPGGGTAALRRRFPGVRIVSLEHDAPRFAEISRVLAGLEGVEPVHAPLGGPLPWFDCRRIEFGEIDLLAVHAGEGRAGKSVRSGACCLRGHLAPGARVWLADAGDPEERRETLEAWMACGGMGVESESPEGCVLLAGAAPEESAAAGRRIGGLAEAAERVFVISLPDRADRRRELEANWAPFGICFEWIEGVRPEQGEIRWEEMKGMEAYGKPGNLRGEYVVGAVGCKRAGIRALRAFLESGAATALICQDDCRWSPDADPTARRAFRELPERWDLLYFSASARQPHRPFSPHLVRLSGARLCTAILWKREAAEALLPELERCDCEWDVFMERSHAELRAFCAAPMPAYQARSRSDIAGGVVEVPNR